MEEVFSGIKILSLLGFAGLVVFVLGTGHTAAVPVVKAGAFFPYGITGLGQAMLIITFALGGVVTLGVTAGKTQSPRRVLPRAAVLLALGQAVLYALPVLALVSVVPWHDITVQASPFILGLKKMGLGMFGTAFNVAILSASLSLLIGSMFSGIVIMVSLSRAKEAPSFLARQVGWRKMHLNALITNTVALVVVAFTTYFLPKTAYEYVTSSAGFFSIFTWLYVLTGQLVFTLRKMGNDRRILPLFTGISGIIALVVITIISLRAYEQRIAILFPVILTMLLLMAKIMFMEPRTEHRGGGGSIAGMVAGISHRLKRRV